MHYADLLDRDVAAYEQAVYDAGPPPAEPPPSRADEFSFASTMDWTDEQLATAYNDVSHDVAALEALESIMDQRDELERARDVAIAETAAERAREAEQWNSWDYHHDDSPLTNPAVRTARTPVNSERECRDEYDSYTYVQYMAAEDECRGNLLNREGKAKGIDPETLFSGPTSVAAKYASPELKTFWGNHGRVTYIEWRHARLGRESDRKAAATARRQSLGEYVQ